MFSLRIAPAVLGAVLILAAGAMPVTAAKPERPAPSAGRVVVPRDRALTPAEQTASDRKIAAALRYLASPEAGAVGRASLTCVTPDGVPPTASAVGDPATTQQCDVPRGFLPVSARDQSRSHYCGPAVGQVIANYTWAVPLDKNKYKQAQIAAWMRTDESGGTSVYAMEYGLEKATIGAPRRPANWDWVVSFLSDTDRDGAEGDQLHDYVRANVSGSRMALAISVKPHDPAGRFHLSSWPRPVSSPGHWITAYGWRGLYDGSDASKIMYTDSSRDEGGSTGIFFDPMRHVAEMIMDHTQRFVW